MARKPAKNQCKLMCCALSDETIAKIRQGIVEWVAGKYAEERQYGPACHCGVRGAKTECPRHA